MEGSTLGTSSNANHFPKAPPPSSITVVTEFLHASLGGTQYSVHNGVITRRRGTEDLTSGLRS